MSLQKWSDEAAGLPARPRAGSATCWSNIRFRHVTQMSVCVLNVLATVTMYVDILSLLLVIVYIIFILATIIAIISANPQYVLMTPHSDKVLVSAGLGLMTVFYHCIMTRDTTHESSYTVLLLLTMSCALSSLVSPSTLLCGLSCLLATWSLHMGINHILQVSLCQRQLFPHDLC